jgi:hypothetical protein
MPYRILDLDTYTITPAASYQAAMDLARYNRAYQIWRGRSLVCQVGV